MVKLKEAIIIFSVILLSVSFASAISDIRHSVDGNKINLTFQGTPPFWINIRNDDNIGQPGGYVWARTNSNKFAIDLGFAINPANVFYYGVKDVGWSSVYNFEAGSAANGGCVDTIWEPDPSTVYDGQEFTQISNCRNKRISIGTKVLSHLSVIPTNFHCFLRDFADNPECSDFYVNGDIACPTYYNPVCGVDGKFYPSACWAEQLGTTVDSYGYCPELVEFFKELWLYEGFDVPSPNIEFTYTGSGLSNWKSGVWLRSTLWKNETDFSILDYNIKAYIGSTYTTATKIFDKTSSYIEAKALIPVIGTNPKSLLVFIMFDDAYPEQVLLDWTATYESLMNDYISKKQEVSNPIQYELVPVVIPPPEGVEVPSTDHIYFSNEENQKIYDAAVQKIGSQDFDILVVAPVFIHGFGGYFTWWNDMEYIEAPLTPPANYSETDKKSGLDALAAFQLMFLTISHEVLHAVGFSGDHMPMGYGTVFLEWNRPNMDFTTGEYLTGEEVEPCEFLANSPDYYAVELPTEFEINVGEEPEWLIKISSDSGDCLMGLYQNEMLKDYDKDGKYEIMYKNNLIGIELQRTLGWVDIDGDGIAELADPDAYGGWSYIS